MKKWLLLWVLLGGSVAFTLANLDPMLLQEQLTWPKNQENLTPESGFDLFSDNSLHKFLDEKNPFSVANYQPVDLVQIESDFTANNARKFQLRAEAAQQFADMAWHFHQQHPGKRFRITSAFRSYAFQSALAKNCSKTLCAEAGTSEHQAWLALDLGTNKGRLDAASLARLQNHAHHRGFHQSYQKGPEVDGKRIEPRHWRYLGTGLATELWQKKMSFTERFYQQKIKK